MDGGTLALKGMEKSSGAQQTVAFDPGLCV